MLVHLVAPRMPGCSLLEDMRRAGDRLEVDCERGAEIALVDPAEPVGEYLDPLTSAARWRSPPLLGGWGS